MNLILIIGGLLIALVLMETVALSPYILKSRVDQSQEPYEDPTWKE